MLPYIRIYMLLYILQYFIFDISKSPPFSQSFRFQRSYVFIYISKYTDERCVRRKKNFNLIYTYIHIVLHIFGTRIRIFNIFGSFGKCNIIYSELSGFFFPEYQKDADLKQVGGSVWP